MDDRIYYLGFSSFPGIGPARFKKLIAHFGNAKSAWHAESVELKNVSIPESLINEFIQFRTTFSPSIYYEELNKKKINFCTLHDADYPKLLSEIKNPPIVLYRKGNLAFNILEQQKPIAVVGSRNITPYGREVTQFLVRELVRAGCIIVSGLAIGVDTVAHATTIEEHGKTIAVLGSGVDNCHPKTNENLYNKIIESGGAILSEMLPGVDPVMGSFPSRNRIIAGLSLATIVTEGAEDSGALITAKNAFANNRKVFAIPGPITSKYSKGPNSLFSKGAVAVTEVHDLLKILDVRSMKKSKEIKGDTKEEQQIIDLLQNGQMHVDQLIKQINSSPAHIGTTLSIMEMKGTLRNCGPGIFSLSDLN